MQQEKSEWLAFGYKMANLPSRCRVYVWRKLEALGAIRYQQGVVLLPQSDRFVKIVSDLKDDIVRFGGNASIASVNFFDPKDEVALVKKFNENIRCAYVEMEHALKNFSEELEKIRIGGKTTQAFLDEKLMALKRHKKIFEEILKRDHFKTGYHKSSVKLFYSILHAIEKSRLKISENI